jgi:hypothetical protein
MPSYTLNITQSLQNYGLEIFGNTLDPVFVKGTIDSKPNVSISGASCFIDYSNSYNNSDRVYLIKMFKNTPSGTTFYFSNGLYYDEILNYRTEVSGIFSLGGITNSDRLIIGNIISGFTSGNTYSFYTSENFVNIPSYTTGYTGSTLSNYILNNIVSSSEKSFIDMGILGEEFDKEEYLEIVGSSSNIGKHKLNSSLKLKDKKEIIYFQSGIVSENLKASQCVLNQYLRGNANPTVLSRSRRRLGCYVVYDSNGNKLNCFEKQNELQAFLREQYENSNYSIQWVVCDSCSRLADSYYSASNVDKSFAFDNSLFLIVDQYTNNTGQIVSALYGNYPSNINTTLINNVAFTTEVGVKVDLSHPSLKGYSVTVYSDSSKNVIVTDDIYFVGTPGTDQSCIYLIKTQDSSNYYNINFLGTNNLSFVLTFA